MKPTRASIGGSHGDKWIIRSSRTVTTSTTIEGRITVNERVEYWTGTNWHSDPDHARTFGSAAEVDNYIEANRSTLEGRNGTI